jgi:ABC-type multidrug transport system fused ATPase/permease subunit
LDTGLLQALWRTRTYVLPQLKHFLAYGALEGARVLLGLAFAWLLFEFITNKVFLSQPLNEFQAGLLGLDPALYVAVDSLSAEARTTVRNLALPLLVLALLAGRVLEFIMPYYNTWILQRVNQQLRVAMMDRAVHLSLRYHSDSTVGDAIYRVYQDSAMVTNVVQNALIAPVTVLIAFGAAYFALSFFAPSLGVMFLVAGIVALVVAYVFTPVLRRRSQRAREANSELTAHIQESVRTVRLLKACQAEGFAIDQFDTSANDALDRSYEIRKTVAQLNLCALVITGLVVLATQYLMSNWVWDGVDTFGYGVVAVVGFAVWNLGAFQAAREQMIAVSVSGGRLVSLWSILQDMTVGLKRAFFLLDLEPEVKDRPNAQAMPTVRTGVEFKDVTFGYDPQKPVVKGLSFVAHPGTITAIVGNTGAGKSTLLNLLLRLYEVDGGAIEIDGVDVRDIRVQSLRDGTSVVLQENALFPTSIADNIRYAAPDAAGAEVVAAAEVACADEFVRALEQGYDTELGERGSKLSTGQRQRISIARAVLKDAPILILDEPTASLDVHTEHAVMQRIAQWGRDRVIFLVTHRIATIRQADQILFVENGSVVEQGTPDALMAIENGRYRHFVDTELAAAS